MDINFIYFLLNKNNLFYISAEFYVESLVNHVDVRYFMNIALARYGNLNTFNYGISRFFDDFSWFDVSCNAQFNVWTFN